MTKVKQVTLSVQTFMKTLLTLIGVFSFYTYTIGQNSIEDAFLIDLDAEATVELWQKEDIKVEVYWIEKGVQRYVMEQIVPKSEYLQAGKTKKGKVVIETADVEEWTDNIVYLLYIPKTVELTIKSEHVTLASK